MKGHSANGRKKGRSEKKMTTATKRTRQFGMDGIHSDTLLPTGASPSAKRKGGAKYKSNGVIIGSKWKVQTMGDGLNITISKNTGKIVGGGAQLAGQSRSQGKRLVGLAGGSRTERRTKAGNYRAGGRVARIELYKKCAKWKMTGRW
jgi:hypothetical protein